MAILDQNPAAAARPQPRRKDADTPASTQLAQPPLAWMADLPPSVVVKLTTHRHGDVPNLTENQLYDAARRHRAVKQTAREQAKYVLAVHQDKVVAVYEPLRWRRVPNENRIYSFTGKPAPAAIRKQYIGQDYPMGRPGVRYINIP